MCFRFFCIAVSPMSAQLDFRDKAFRRDPHEEFARMRALDSIVEAKGLGAQVVVRYHESKELLKDRRLQLDHFNREQFPAGHPMQAYFRMRDGLMLFANTPRHQELREPAKDAFAPKGIKRYEKIIREVAQKSVSNLKSALEEGRSVEFIKEISLPFVSEVICRVVGMPEQDHLQLSSMTQSIADGLDPFGPQHSLERAGEGYVRFREYMAGEINRGRWRKSADEFVNSFLGDIAHCPHMLGGFQSHDDLISTTVMLLSAGHLTTNHSLALSLVSLLSDPDHSTLLTEGASPVTQLMIEELFRYHAPAQITRRRVVEEINIAGHCLAPGQAIWIAIASANRDESVFHNPQELDFTRKPNPHLSFGGGEHFCLGLHLARLQLRVFLEELQGAIPDLKIGRIVHDHNIIFRGIKQLELTY